MQYMHHSVQGADSMEWGWWGEGERLGVGVGGGMGVLMTHVDFKKCCMSLSLIIAHVLCRIQEMPMSHVSVLFEPM